MRVFEHGFDMDFWLYFQKIWNYSSDSKLKAFSTIRCASIIITDQINESVTIYWDSEGTISNVNSGTNKECVNSFAANKKDWIRFLSMESSAGKMLVRGKLKFIGNKIFLLQHGTKFEIFPKIIAEMNKTKYNKG